MTQDSSASPSLDGLRMNVVSTASNGVVNHETIFEFTQSGRVVRAEYSGGRVVHGSLIGLRTASELVFRFVQVQDEDVLASGDSSCTIERGLAGRIRLVERFRWENGDTGENVFEELPP